jgi:hypothetical protein
MMLQRPGLKPVQKYYTVSFLNKIAVICGNDEKARINLFRAYFFMFRNIL